MDWVRVAGDAREALRVLGAFETYIWSVPECATRLGWTQQRVTDTLAYLLEARLVAPLEDGYLAAPLSQREAFTTVIYSPRSDAVTIIWPEDDEAEDRQRVLDDVLSTTDRLVWRQGQDGAPSVVEILNVSAALHSQVAGRADDAELLDSLGLVRDIVPEEDAHVLRLKARIDPWDIGLAPRIVPEGLGPPI